MWPFTLPYYISQKIFAVDHVSVYKSNELGSVSINHLHCIMCPFTVVNKALDSFFNITRSFIKHNIRRRVFQFFIGNYNSSFQFTYHTILPTLSGLMPCNALGVGRS
jgi:hypothetical protein